MEKKIDYGLLIIFIILIFVSFFALISASAPLSYQKFRNGFYYAKHQFFFGFLPGLFLLFFCLKVNLEKLKKTSFLLVLINLFLTILVFIPGLGFEFRGGTRWISFGPISFQPSEFLKLTFFIYLAAWLASRTEKEKKLNQTFLVFLILIGIISLTLLAQPDMSTLGIILATSITMFFLAKTPLWQTSLIILLAVISFLPLVKLAHYRFLRFLTFLNPEIDPLGIGYHIKQAQIAIGSGKIFGLGLGLSQQKLGILPQSFSDSIFAIFAEETGFLGSSFLIFLYLLFFLKGFKIGREKKDAFEKILALGISFWIFFQAFVNIGAMIRILPLSGTPLPFLSYGGSHLIVEMAGVGLLLNISKK